MAIVSVVTDPAENSSADVEDETASLLAIPGLRESLAEADADYAAGRIYGEDAIRARFGLSPRDAS